MSAHTDLRVAAAATFSDACVASSPPAQDALVDQAVELAGQSGLALAYAFLQKVVGVLAIALPFVVALGNWVAGGTAKGSISAYYYSHLGNWFVGTLCALAVFFLSYHLKPLPGHKKDKLISRAAAVMAVGVAMFPTTSSAPVASTGSQWVGRVHISCAGVLFVLLGVLSLLFFTKTGAPDAMTSNKKKRNLVYRICAFAIFACIVLIGVVYLTTWPPSSWHPVFYLESIAVVAFGVSWLVKGGIGFADPPPD